MEPLTLLFFLLAMGLFILTVYRRKSETKFLTLCVGVFSLLTGLTDISIGTALPYLVILDFLIIMISITWLLFPKDGE